MGTEQKTFNLNKFQAITANLEAIMAEFPDFDLDEFYRLAKRINDFLNDPNFEDWAEIITESTKCHAQVEQNFAVSILTYFF